MLRPRASAHVPHSGVRFVSRGQRSVPWRASIGCAVSPSVQKNHELAVVGGIDDAEAIRRIAFLVDMPDRDEAAREWQERLHKDEQDVREKLRAMRAASAGTAGAVSDGATGGQSSALESPSPNGGDTAAGAAMQAAPHPHTIAWGEQASRPVGEVAEAGPRQVRDERACGCAANISFEKKRLWRARLCPKWVYTLRRLNGPRSSIPATGGEKR